MFTSAQRRVGIILSEAAEAAICLKMRRQIAVALLLFLLFCFSDPCCSADQSDILLPGLLADLQQLKRDQLDDKLSIAKLNSSIVAQQNQLVLLRLENAQLRRMLPRSTRATPADSESNNWHHKQSEALLLLRRGVDEMRAQIDSFVTKQNRLANGTNQRLARGQRSNSNASAAQQLLHSDGDDYDDVIEGGDDGYVIKLIEDSSLPELRGTVAVQSSDIRYLLNLTENLVAQMQQVQNLLEKRNQFASSAEIERLYAEMTWLKQEFRSMRDQLYRIQDQLKWNRFLMDDMQSKLNQLENSNHPDRNEVKQLISQLNDSCGSCAREGVVDLAVQGSGDSPEADEILLRRRMGRTKQFISSYSKFAGLNESEWRSFQETINRELINIKATDLKLAKNLTRIESDWRRAEKVLKELEVSKANKKDVEKELKELDAETVKLKGQQIVLRNKSESLREEFGDLYQMVLKFDKKIEVAQKTAQVVRNIQGEHLVAIASMGTRLNEMEVLLLRYGLKLTTLQAEFLNSSLQAFKSSEHDWRQDAQIERVKAELEKLAHRDKILFDNVKDLKESLGSKASASEFKKSAQSLSDLQLKISVVDNATLNLSCLVDDIAASLQLLETQLPADCRHYQEEYRTTAADRLRSALLIKPAAALQSFLVSCEADGSTVIQQRSNLSLSFNRNWSDFEVGFGNLRPNDDFWLGNEHIHWLTSSHDVNSTWTLAIEMVDVFGDSYSANYDRFEVASAEQQYRLTLAGYSGNVSDSLGLHSGMQFSTSDRDNDASSTHCALFYQSGWWFDHCVMANLNGRFPMGLLWFNNQTSQWLQLRRTKMKIKLKEAAKVDL